MTILIVVLLILTIVALVYDIWLTMDVIEGNTFSELLRAYGKKTPFFPWILSFLAGRWFHPWSKLNRAHDNLPDAATIVIIVALTLVVVVMGAMYKKVRGPEHFIAPWIVVLVGLVAGALVAPIRSF